MKLRDDPDFYEILAMAGCAVIGVGVLASFVVLLPGCASWFSSTVEEAKEAGHTLTTTQAAGGYHVLDWIFNGCLLVAAALGVAAFFAPGTARPNLIGGLVASAVCAIALKVLLVKYLDWIVWAIGIGSIAAGGLYAYAHRWVVEKFLRRDFDGDGVIGEPKQDRPQ